MKLNIEKLYEKIMLRKWLLISLSLIIFLASIISMVGLQWEEDIMTLLPDNDLEINKYRKIISGFNPMDAMFIDIECTGGEEELIAIADSLFLQMECSGFFKKITYKWNYNDLTSALDKMRKFRPVLLNSDDRMILEQKVSVEGITQKLDKWKKILSESPAPFLTAKLYSDPLDFDEVLMKKLNSFQTLTGSIQINKGRMFTADMQHILLIAYPKISSTDSGNSVKLIGFMDGVVTYFQKNDIQISYLAGHRFSVENAGCIKRDIKLIMIISLLAIIILAILVYSRPFLILLTLLPAVFGSAFALGLIRWIIPEISAVAIGAGAMLIGITVDYGIHLLYHTDQMETIEKDEYITKITRPLLRPLLMGAGTTFVAFMTLQFSTLPGYRQLGLFAATGIVGAVLFVLFVLPFLIPHLKKKKRNSLIPLTGLFPHFFRWTSGNKITISILLIGLSILVMPGFIKLQFEGDIQKLNAASPEIRKDYQRILASFGDAMASTMVVVVGRNMEDALQNNELVARKLKQMQADSIVKNYNSLAELLPSNKSQNVNREGWNEFINKTNPDYLKINFGIACNKLRMEKGFFDKFINSLKHESKNLDYLNLKNTMLDEIIARQVAFSHKKVMVLTTVRLMDKNDFLRFRQNLQELVSDIIIYNGEHFVKEMVQIIYKELKRMGLISLTFVLLLLIFYKRNLKTIIVMILPLFFSFYWTFGIMGWFGIKINIMNCIVVIFIFGLVIDYCIFLVSACEKQFEEKAEYIIIASGAITISAITTMFGLGALVLAKHPALHSLGLTALLGISSGLLAVILIIPPVFYNETDVPE